MGDMGECDSLGSCLKEIAYLRAKLEQAESNFAASLYKSRVVLGGLVTLTVEERDVLVAAWDVLQKLAERLYRSEGR